MWNVIVQKAEHFNTVFVGVVACLFRTGTARFVISSKSVHTQYLHIATPAHLCVQLDCFYVYSLHTTFNKNDFRKKCDCHLAVVWQPGKLQFISMRVQTQIVTAVTTLKEFNKRF